MLGKMYFGSEAPAHSAYREIDSPRSAQEARPRALCALRNVRRPPPAGCRAMPARARGLPDSPSIPEAAAPDWQHCQLPKGWLAHTPHSSHRADSPRVYLAALALSYHRPCRMIAGPGQTHPATMAREPLPQTHCLRRSLDPAVGRLPEDGRDRIATDLPELVQGDHGSAGDEHHLALVERNL